MKPTFEIPYDRQGNVPTYPQESYGWDWRPNEVFETALSIENFSRGRSAANFNVVNMQNGAKYTMFLTDFLYLLQNHVLDHGKTPMLKWMFAKRGQNYGVKLAK